MKFNVSVSGRAWADADRIFKWIELRSPTGSIRWNDAFVAAILSLKNEAEQHALAPEDTKLRRNIRQCLFKTRRGQQYRLIYTIVGADVRVLRVRGPGQPPITTGDVAE